jgi:hypothetical protein
MAKIIAPTNDSRPTKFERVYEDDDSIDTWKYDLDKNPNGPIEVDIKYKRSYIHPALKPTKKYMKDLLKEQKKSPTKK